MNMQDLREYARLLEKASVWPESRKAFGYLKGAEKHYIYEFYCYLRVLNDLRTNYTLTYCKGSGANANKFPQSPAKKKGRPFFMVQDKSGKALFQVCAGTKVQIRVGKMTKAPDISFQGPTADSTLPKANEVEFILDAKYHRSGNTKTQESQFFAFWVMIDSLGLTRAHNVKVQWNKLLGMKGNCLLTNGLAHSKDGDYLSIRKITQVEHFDEGKKCKFVSF